MVSRTARVSGRRTDPEACAGTQARYFLLFSEPSAGVARLYPYPTRRQGRHIRPPLPKGPEARANDVGFTHQFRDRAATGAAGRPGSGPVAARLSAALVTPSLPCRILSRAGCHADARPFFVGGVSRNRWPVRRLAMPALFQSAQRGSIPLRA